MGITAISSVYMISPTLFLFMQIPRFLSQIFYGSLFRIKLNNIGDIEDPCTTPPLIFLGLNFLHPISVVMVP